MEPIVFTNLTRNIEIGANCYTLEMAGKKLLLDAGMHPRSDDNEPAPRFDLVPDDSVDAIFLTHAHQDHVGCVPLAMRKHPRAPLFTTEATTRLSDVMLHNSVNVMTRRAEEGQPGNVLFTHREVEQGLRRWRSIPLGQRFDITGERLRPDEPADVACELFDAGHILGSCGVLLESGGRRVFYTGDVNFDDQTVIQGAKYPEGPFDLLIVECTRGDHATAEDFTRAAEEARFAAALQEVLARGGCVFIPVFALGKTQEVLAMLHEFMRTSRVQSVPIYIGGLSTKLTEIFDRLADKVPRNHRNLKLLQNDLLFTLSGKEAFSTQLKPGRIYALSSGMMSENTLSNRLVRQVLGGRKNGLFFVGYADPSSPAGKLLATAPGEDVQLDPALPKQSLDCEVKTFAFSGHSTRESIRAFIKRSQPKNVILVHGDPGAIAWMQRAIQEDLPESKVLSALPGVPLSV